ncbi:atherin-like isoform X3 [Rattus rattus]|uniref:atherin-like isoform X3 n=1 Tax=Rattus rattus TaxID=10117 RepID=UPI0013F33901|nr:atherin-like isoform X3 [Rattus rattus]
MRRRRRKVSAIHAGPRPRPAAAASSKQRGRGLGTARSAGGARAARRRRCPGSPEAQTAEPVSTPADWASPRAAALRAGDRRAGPWSAEASRRDSSILLNVVPHSAPVGPPPHPSIVPQPQTGVRSSGHPSTATGITWAATPQCLACCPRARSFPVDPAGKEHRPSTAQPSPASGSQQTSVLGSSIPISGRAGLK